MKSYRSFKKYLSLTPLEPVVTKKEVKTSEQKDKEARIYALAQELHVKIGG